MRRALLGGAMAVSLLLCSIDLPAQAPPPKKSWVAKLAQAFPDPDRLRDRRIAAENRALFQGNEPIALTVTADFRTINKDRTVSSPRRYPAALTLQGASSVTQIPVKLGSRGHFRLHPLSCSFVPLRVEFPPDVAGTVFEGQKALKLVTHCRDVDEYEQYTLHEYLVYRLFNLMTPLSFRARLVKATYVDEATGKQVAKRYAMFLEDDDDVARRMEGRIVDVPNALFRDVHPESLLLMSLFQYMIANTDYSIIKLHNVKIVQTRERILYTVPYDFDFSGLVNTRYSNPAKNLNIASVRDRLYRGPCQTEAQLEPLLERFRSKKGELMAVYESLPDMGDSGRRDAQKFLQEFFSVIERKDRVKKMLVDACIKTAGM
jgi:hypothetical protein